MHEHFVTLLCASSSAAVRNRPLSQPLYMHQTPGPPPPPPALHRERHIGKFKAEVAAEVIMERVPGVTVTAHKGYVQVRG